MKTRNATQEVWNALVSGKQLTGLDILFNFGAKRESSIIHRLREKHGYNAIITKMETSDEGKTYARYYMNEENRKKYGSQKQS